MTDITKYGAIGDGQTDCSPAIKKALECESEIFFPSGTFLITEELLIPSNRHIKLSDDAVIFAKEGCFNKAGIRAVITNADYENGNENIIFEGGTVNANNHGNHKADWNKGPSQGLTFSFINVTGLTVRNLTIINSESYHIRMVKTSSFTIENLLFTADCCPFCQDGIHMSGYCHDGVIRNIRAENGCANDDLIAFNADDVNFYSHNWGQINGPIHDIVVENVCSDNCYGAVRMLSVESEISNIVLRNFTVGVREMAFNLDAARYCADPMFTDEQYPNGVGNIKNVLIENVTTWKAPLDLEHVYYWNTNRFSNHPLLTLETNGEITFKNIKRDLSRDINPDAPTIKVKNVFGSLKINDELHTLNGDEKYFSSTSFDLSLKK